MWMYPQKTVKGNIRLLNYRINQALETQIEFACEIHHTRYLNEHDSPNVMVAGEDATQLFSPATQERGSRTTTTVPW